MARRSFSRAGRAVASHARQQQALERAHIRMVNAAAVQAQKAARQQARQAAVDHTVAREMETKEDNDDLLRREHELRGILKAVRDSRAPLDFRAMQVVPSLPVFDDKGLQVAGKMPYVDDFMPPKLTFLERLVPGASVRYDERVQSANEHFEKAMELFRLEEDEKQKKLADLKATHQKACDAADADAKARNAETSAFQAAYVALDPDAVIEYFTLVFEADALPDNLPEGCRVTYDGDSKQLVIERELPSLDAMPADGSYRYVKKSDEIVAVARKAADLKALYADVLAQIALRSLRVAMKADTAKSVSIFSFNGFVDTIDPRTGARVKPTLISVTAVRDALETIAFDRVVPTECLKGLKALVSRSAHELEPVRPLVNFDMVDKRFIEKTDVLAELESRPNLAEMTPSEFETLMTNLFEKMGLETRLTQASRDGGVDCVAWDMRPVVGGKVVIQAKRYRNTVGVSAVRDLYGTMMNEGAAKGILVATSGYGDTAYEFVKNKPLELITGSNLLSMLEEYAGIKARIEFPQTWVDGAEHWA